MGKNSLFHLIPALLIGASSAALDQLTKSWAGRNLAGSPPVEVISNFFHLVYHRNTGGVFGLFSGEVSPVRKLVFTAVTLLALAFIVYLITQWGRESRIMLVGLSLVAGGAVGNLIDRIRYGEVVDFIDWHWYSHHWPTFNIADAAIVVGAALLLITSFKGDNLSRSSSRAGTKT